MSRSGYRGVKFKEPFVGIVRSVFDSPAFVQLSPHAVKLLMELAGQYKGDNNGDLTVAMSVMAKRGWKSRTTLWRCKSELIEAGFVHVTRIGHLPNTCELLALTWFPLDVSPKFDADAIHTFKARAYMANTPLPMPTIKEKLDWSRPNGDREDPKKRNPLSTAGTIGPSISPFVKH